MKTIGYLRVSKIDQDIEKNKSDILLFANEKKNSVKWNGLRRKWAEKLVGVNAKLLKS